jgi:hypothetical protein
MNQWHQKYQGENNMQSLLTLLIVLFLFPISVECAITKEFGSYYGKVIDAETKEPIDGAAVLVVFYTESYGPAGAITHYADALETVTDTNGKFKIPEHRISLFRPLQGWKKHGYFTIFKPGYGHYPDSEGVKPMFVPNATLPEDQDVTVELPRLRTLKDRKEAGTPNIQGDVPYEKQQKLIELVNEELSFWGVPNKIDRKAWELYKK